MPMPLYPVSEDALQHLKARDKVLARAIEQIGPVRRELEPDLFAALLNAIVGQQISTKAQATIWARIQAGLGPVTPQRVAACTPEELQAFGLSFRKVRYMQNAAAQVLEGQLDLDALHTLPDAEVCTQLCRLDGIGVWTAEMLMTFSMQRPDIISYGDLAILRGMRMLYRHREISRERFERYRRRYSPHATVASLYLWAIAGGAIEGLADPAAKPPARPKRRV